MGHNTDQTDQSELIRFVEKLKREWMATVDALVDPLMIVSPDYRIHKSNRALSLRVGLQPQELVGQRCYEVFAKRSQPCPGCRMLEAGRQGVAQTYDLETENGRFYFEVGSHPLEGAEKAMVQVYRDRTDRRRLERQLVQNEKLASIGLLAGGVAHEINNPLGGILVFAEMLHRELPADSRHHEDVKEIIAAAQRCKEIVENLLLFARAQPIQKNHQVAPAIDVREAITTALRFARVSVEHYLVEIEADLGETPRLVTMDRNHLVQVILNLVQNASQAMPDGGKVDVSVQDAQEPGSFEILVSDTGVGIPEENLSTIFDPFFTTKEPGEGTGLGLAICFGLVKDAGGRIEVNSVINEGTTFRVVLPEAKR